VGFCPLCHDRNLSSLDSGLRKFWICLECFLIAGDSRQFLDAATEKARYETHENDMESTGYRQHLSRILNPMKDILPPQSQGLDFGCGPGPLLIKMFQELGFEMSGFDPFFLNDASVLEKKYDFIAATEVVEHFHSPRREFELISKLIRPGGYVGIMTEMWSSAEDFPHWYYIKDPTHVSFYHANTMRWIATKFDWKIKIIASRICIFQAND